MCFKKKISLAFITGGVLDPGSIVPSLRPSSLIPHHLTTSTRRSSAPATKLTSALISRHDPSHFGGLSADVDGPDAHVPSYTSTFAHQRQISDIEFDHTIQELDDLNGMFAGGRRLESKDEKSHIVEWIKQTNKDALPIETMAMAELRREASSPAFTDNSFNFSQAVSLVVWCDGSVQCVGVHVVCGCLYVMGVGVCKSWVCVSVCHGCGCVYMVVPFVHDNVNDSVPQSEHSEMVENLRAKVEYLESRLSKVCVCVCMCECICVQVNCIVVFKIKKT